MAGTVYLDSSALVKLVVVEPESWALGDYVRDRDAIASDIARVELPRAVRRLGVGDGAEAHASAALGTLTLLKLDRTTLIRASAVEPSDLKSLDAIHLATAVSIPELEAFVTYDRRLADAAEQAGLRVASPA